MTDRLLLPLEGGGVRFELAEFRRLLERLNRPQDRVPAVLIAGTNGKGSTAAFLASILDFAGYRVGLYTSPHLETVLERVRIGGRTVSDRDLASALERIFAAARDRSPTHFEALTAAGFLIFADAALDVAILEVGLGGRLDATNVVEPMLSVVTPVGLDHQEYLGSTIAEIAAEKAGIFRRGVPALAAPMDPNALAVLKRVADSLGAPFETLDPAPGSLAISGVVLQLAGRHQEDNARVAARSAETLGRKGFDRIDGKAIRRGLERCLWPGRLERVEWPRGVVLLDGAHNLDGAAVLTEHLAHLEAPFDLLVGALSDKRPDQWLPGLASRSRQVWTTTVSSPRALPAAQLAELIRASTSVPATPIPIPTVALRSALGQSRLLVVTGSLYLVGELRTALRELTGVPQATWESSLFTTP